MSVPAAYLGVVFIWATTPLAIKWSSEGLGPWLGVSTRMLIGLFVCLVLVALLSRRMRWHRPAFLTYLAAGLGLWGAMSSAYWGSQFIASGLLSVVYGLSPVVTGLLALWLLRERALNLARVTGMLFGLAGLSLVFAHSLQFAPAQLPGLLAVLLSVLLHSLSSVWVKRIAAGLHPLETATGALLIALPLFWMNWLLAGGQPLTPVEPRVLGAVLYLGVIASSLGFSLYYYVLREVSAGGVSLISLMAPMLALQLGGWLNAEQFDVLELAGCGLVLAGLAVYQWGAIFALNLRSRVAQAVQR